MKKWLPVLAVFAGFGSRFFFAQKPSIVDPYDRYLAAVSRNSPEPYLRRFSAECGVDMRAVKPRFAEAGDGEWIQVKHLNSGESGLETDFFSTAEVWNFGKRIVVETWSISGSDGNESRTFYCFLDKKAQIVDSIDWQIPQVEGPDAGAWGYKRRWQLSTTGKMQRLKVAFVDVNERPIAKPKLDADTQQDLENETVGPKTWSDLKLPEVLLQQVVVLKAVN